MDYSILAVDLDGTLLNEEKEIDHESIEAIQEFRASGRKVVICSGRTPLSTRWIAETIGLTDAIIAYNGAVIQSHKGEMMEKCTFSQSAVITFLEFCNSQGIYSHLYEGETLLISEENQWNHGWVEKNVLSLKKTGGNPAACEMYRNQCSVKLVKDLKGYIESGHPEISKIAVFHDSVRLYNFSRQLEEQYRDYEISSSLDYTNLEISPAGVTKAAALTKLANQLGVPLSKVAAIGDNYNDMKMLKAAGLGIAMGNAPEKVKETADAVTDTNDQAGVAKAIRNFILCH